MCTIFLTLAYLGSIFTGVEFVLLIGILEPPQSLTIVHIGLFIPSIIVHKVPLRILEYLHPYVLKAESNIKPHQEKLMKKIGLIKEPESQSIGESKKDK